MVLYIETECTADVASVKLFTLTRFAKETFTLLMEMLTDAVFPEEEMELFATQNIQQLRINRKKVEYLARVKFNHLLFPSGHPYGRIADEESYRNIHRMILKNGTLKNILRKTALLFSAEKRMITHCNI